MEFYIAVWIQKPNVKQALEFKNTSIGPTYVLAQNSVPFLGNSLTQ